MILRRNHTEGLISCTQLCNSKWLAINGGHWGVGISAENRELLVAISSLIRCGRVKQALSIIDNELAGGC